MVINAPLAALTDEVFRAMESLTGLLLVPVLGAELLFLAWALWLIGAAVAQRRGGARPRREVLERAGLEARARLLTGQPTAAANAVLVDRRPIIVALAVSLRELGAEATRREVAEAAYGDLELVVSKELEPSRIHTRVGPMLGLMATLIPLGPALGDLANRDVTSLAGKLEIAFTAPVLGLLIGGLGFATVAVRTRLFAQEMADAGTILEALAPQAHPDHAAPAVGDAAGAGSGP